MGHLEDANDDRAGDLHSMRALVEELIDLRKRLAGDTVTSRRLADEILRLQAAIQTLERHSK